MKKPIAILAAGAILVLGATAAAFAGNDAPAGPGPAAVAPTIDTDAVKPNPLKEVLDELVANHTISQAQADKIVAALDAKRAEAKAAFEAKRGELKAARDATRETMKAARTQLKAFLEDGVISADELAQLPADSPLRGLGNGVLDDGTITLDELKSLRGEGFGHRGPGFGGWFEGHGFGAPPVPPTTGS